uniref:Uncharacterized protein n=1 Tax=Anguilla anguilla TaxID=7936 RepID=A0A0E9WFN3_ANGAN
MNYKNVGEKRKKKSPIEEHNLKSKLACTKYCTLGQLSDSPHPQVQNHPLHFRASMHFTEEENETHMHTRTHSHTLKSTCTPVNALTSTQQ